MPTVASYQRAFQPALSRNGMRASLFLFTIASLFIHLLRSSLLRFVEIKTCCLFVYRGFGFVTFLDQAGVDQVLAVTRHELDSKTVSVIYLFKHSLRAFIFYIYFYVSC